jgi:hypothetical protein
LEQGSQNGGTCRFNNSGGELIWKGLEPGGCGYLFARDGVRQLGRTYEVHLLKHPADLVGYALRWFILIQFDIHPRHNWVACVVQRSFNIAPVLHNLPLTRLAAFRFQAIR